MSATSDPTPATASEPEVTVDGKTAALNADENVVSGPGSTPTVPIIATAEPIAAPASTTPDIKESAKEDPPIEEEPQNALTKKFTEQEWKALKEFRKKLPEILEKSYDGKTDAKITPVILWGVRIDPNNPKDARVSVILLKFLRARNLNVRSAEDMMVATLRWRGEFKVEEVVKEEFPADVFAGLGHVHGKDKEGRPVVYNIYGGNQDLKAVFGDVDRFIRWRIALQEKSVSLLDFETVDQTLQIHDYDGVSLRNRDSNSKNAAAQASGIFQDHYPEFLYRKYFINVPMLLTWIFWAFKPLISAATLSKMSVVGTGHHAIKKALVEVIDVNELPKKYGGEAEGW